MRHRTTILAAAALLLLGAGCLQPPATPAVETQVRMEATAFDPMTARTGDSFGGWTLVSLGPNATERPMSAGNYHAVFSGEAEVTGTYRYFNEEFAGLGDVVCMTLEESEAKKLPGGLSHFCLTDIGASASKFGPLGSQGTATVRISSLDYGVLADTDAGFSKATLVSVIGITGTRPLEN